jgi:hypothetical protein
MESKIGGLGKANFDGLNFDKEMEEFVDGFKLDMVLGKDQGIID